jgi:nucleotide-binding universal stress UspA family protein
MVTICHHILFCSDFSDDAHFAFSHAVYQCKTHKAKLHVMHVALSPDSYFGPVIEPVEQGNDILDEQKQVQKITEQIMIAMRLQYEPSLREVDSYTFVVRFGSPDVEIIKYAHENEIQMIFMGVVGRVGSHRGRLLRTAANVSKYSDCQVVTIGRSKKEGLRNLSSKR